MKKNFEQFIKSLGMDSILENTVLKGFTVFFESYSKEIHKDRIPGGLADNKKPSDFDKNQLALGIKVELEHTSDKNIAEEIAMDHLTEDKEYYIKLKKMEGED